MNAIFAAPRTPTTISLACPWCAEPLALDDAFAATELRCDPCAITVDLQPVAAIAARPEVEVAA